MRLKSLSGFLLTLGALLALVIVTMGTALLDRAGRYLAPRDAAGAEAVIIEGEELLQEVELRVLDLLVKL